MFVSPAFSSQGLALQDSAQCLVCAVLGTEPRAAQVLGKHSAKGAISLGHSEGVAQQ